MSAEAPEIWQSLSLPWGGRWKEESQEHLHDEGLGLLGTRWWWSHLCGSGTSCLPSRMIWDKLFDPSGPQLFSITLWASACYTPPEKDPRPVMNGQADIAAGQVDSIAC